MRFSTPLLGLVLLLLTVGVVSVAPAAEPRLKPVAGFLKIPKGLPLGAASGVDVDSKGRVYLFQGGLPPLEE